MLELRKYTKHIYNLWTYMCFTTTITTIEYMKLHNVYFIILSILHGAQNLVDIL